METSFILKDIEMCREEMLALSNKHGMASSQVIECSKRLDCLLNKYEQAKDTTLDKNSP